MLHKLKLWLDERDPFFREPRNERILRAVLLLWIAAMFLGWAYLLFFW